MGYLRKLTDLKYSHDKLTHTDLNRVMLKLNWEMFRNKNKVSLGLNIQFGFETGHYDDEIEKEEIDIKTLEMICENETIVMVLFRPGIKIQSDQM